MEGCSVRGAHANEWQDIMVVKVIGVHLLSIDFG